MGLKDETRFGTKESSPDVLHPAMEGITNEPR